MLRGFLVVRSRQHGSRRWIQNQLLGFAVREVEHAVQRSSLDVVGVSTDAAQAPVVLDEAKNGRLVRGQVIDVVLFRVGRNHQERLTGAVTALPLRRGGRGAATARSGERVVRDGRLVGYGSENVIVPAV